MSIFRKKGRQTDRYKAGLAHALPRVLPSPRFCSSFVPGPSAQAHAARGEQVNWPPEPHAFRGNWCAGFLDYILP